MTFGDNDVNENLCKLYISSDKGDDKIEINSHRFFEYIKNTPDKKISPEEKIDYLFLMRGEFEKLDISVEDNQLFYKVHREISKNYKKLDKRAKKTGKK